MQLNLLGSLAQEQAHKMAFLFPIVSMRYLLGKVFSLVFI